MYKINANHMKKKLNTKYPRIEQQKNMQHS